MRRLLPTAWYLSLGLLARAALVPALALRAVGSDGPAWVLLLTIVDLDDRAADAWDRPWEG